MKEKLFWLCVRSSRQVGGWDRGEHVRENTELQKSAWGSSSHFSYLCPSISEPSGGSETFNWRTDQFGLEEKELWGIIELGKWPGNLKPWDVRGAERTSSRRSIQKNLMWNNKNQHSQDQRRKHLAVYTQNLLKSLNWDFFLLGKKTKKQEEKSFVLITPNQMEIDDYINENCISRLSSLPRFLLNVEDRWISIPESRLTVGEIQQQTMWSDFNLSLYLVFFISAL